MKIGIGSDHGGFELKDSIKKYLTNNGYEVVDYGTHNTESVDYIEYAVAVSNGVLAGEVECGILMCGTGIGIGISANKINGIRCACVSDEFSARMAKKHNNANIISLGGRTIGPELANSIVDSYLNEEFEGGRHQRRVDKIMALES